MSPGFGSASSAWVPAAAFVLRGVVKPAITPGSRCCSTFSRTLSMESTIGGPGYTVKGSSSPSPFCTTRACETNPEPTIVTVGMPALSTTALARNTAGVHLPQAPMPTMAASQPMAFNLAGSAATRFLSSGP